MNKRNKEKVKGAGNDTDGLKQFKRSEKSKQNKKRVYGISRVDEKRKNIRGGASN